jgi:xanthine dehydrogenase accessory factor
MDSMELLSTRFGNDDRIGVLERAAELRRSGVPFALATVTVSQRPTSARTGAKAVVTADGAIFGWVGGACSQPSVVRHAREAMLDGETRLIRLSPEGGTPRDGVIELAMTCHSGGTLEVFIEPFLPEPYLVAVGETPVAHALLALGRHLGFRTVAMAGGSPDADDVFTDIAFDQLQRDRPAFVVIASMGIVDEDALLAALRSNAAYVALVGSRRRFATLADYARSQGVENERVDAVHAPAGIDIHAETPAEIALSILAQITERRRSRVFSASVGPAALPRTAIDPICGMEVELETARWTLTIADEVVAFCCPACKREYEQRLSPADATAS